MSEQPSSVGIEVLYEVVDDHIAVVTLNRPDKRNAVNGAVASALDYLVKSIEADDAIRVAILASSSDGVFSAGAWPQSLISTTTAHGPRCRAGGCRTARRSRSGSGCGRQVPVRWRC